MNYYVYVCYVDGAVKYVGRGKGQRYKHCTSGTSSNYELNKAHFRGADMQVVKVAHGLSKEAARCVEHERIQHYGIDNLFNKKAEIDSKQDALWYSKIREPMVAFYQQVLRPLYEEGDLHVTEFRKRWDKVDIPVRGFYYGRDELNEFLHLSRHKKSDCKYYITFSNRLSQTEFLHKIRNQLTKA